jgi:hypothetical protein
MDDNVEVFEGVLAQGGALARASKKVAVALKTLRSRLSCNFLGRAVGN